MGRKLVEVINYLVNGRIEEYKDPFLVINGANSVRNVIVNPYHFYKKLHEEDGEKTKLGVCDSVCNAESKLYNG